MAWKIDWKILVIIAGNWWINSNYQLSEWKNVKKCFCCSQGIIAIRQGGAPMFTEII